MPKITLTEAKENYRIWREAEQAQAAGLSYSIAGRSVTRIPLSEILDRIRYWGGVVDQLENPNRRKKRTRAFTPIDS